MTTILYLLYTSTDPDTESTKPELSFGSDLPIVTGQNLDMPLAYLIFEMKL